MGKYLVVSRSKFCSDPACAHKLTADDQTCAGCGGTIAGTIGDPDERLAAEEALRANPVPAPHLDRREAAAAAGAQPADGEDDMR